MVSRIMYGAHDFPAILCCSDGKRRTPKTCRSDIDSRDTTPKIEYRMQQHRMQDITYLLKWPWLTRTPFPARQLPHSRPHPFQQEL